MMPRAAVVHPTSDTNCSLQIHDASFPQDHPSAKDIMAVQTTVYPE